jgi:hypothetical protein
MKLTLRKFTGVATVLLLGLGLASCNENEKPQPAAQQPKGFLRGLQGGQVTYSGGVGAPDGAGGTNGTPGAGMTGPRNFTMPGADLTPVTAQQGAGATERAPLNIPKDARWSLYCASLSGADRIARTTQLKAYLTARSPFKDWYVVHNEQESTLFHGFYPAIETAENPRAAARAQAERKAIQEWKDENGDKPFAGAFFTPITPPNPVAPAEWNLENAPADGYWSVQIMAFKDNALRKQAAVDAVKDFRAKGVEAYYYHGQTISSVCIGAWPRQALKEQEVDKGEATNEDDTVLVSNVPLPARYKNARLRTADGKKIVAYAQRVEIADPSLQATFNQYPDHAVNYEFQTRKVKLADGSMQDLPTPSFLVIIPRAQPSALSGNGMQNVPPPQGAVGTPWQPGNSSTPAGAGRLRGLGN